MENAELYSHRPVRDGGFRIFILQPGGCDMPVFCRMTTNEEYPGSYNTISWAWKYPIEEVLIYIDDLPFYIPKELYSAINALRSPVSECAFWADAICIDMSNLQERFNMIKLFRHIFMKSSRVCVWLGDEDSTSKRGMLFVQRCSSVNDLDGVIRGDRYEDSWNAVLSLMYRPWFSRTWVIQEVAVARKVTIFCGSDSVTWNEFEACISLLKMRSLLYPETYHIESLSACQLVNIIRNVFDRNDQEEIIAPRLSLQTLVTRLSSFQATDDRDRIFSLIGIACDTGVWSGDAHQDIIVSYEKSFAEVCDDFFLFCVGNSGSLDLLFQPWAPKECRNDIHAWICTTDMTPFGLYSGMPKPVRLNADSFVGLSGEPKLYNASGDIKAAEVQITTIDGSRILLCRGQRVDIIGETTAAAVSGIIPAEWFTLGMGSDTDIPEDFWRTLIADRDIQGHRPQHHLQRYLEQALLQDRGKDIYVDQMLKENPFSVVAPTLLRVQAVTYNRQLIRTENRSLLGLVPAVAERGDSIYILHGCSVPVILRKVITGQSTIQYLLVGEAYIHGIMDGEALINSLGESDDLLSIAQFRIPTYTFSTIEEEVASQSNNEGGSKEKTIRRETPTPFLPLLKDFQDINELSLHPRHLHNPPLDTLEPDLLYRRYQIQWKCTCGHRGQDIITEYRRDTIHVLVESLRAEGVSVNLERIGISDPLIDFFKHLLQNIWIIVENQLNGLKQFHKSLTTTLEVNEPEPPEEEELAVSTQPELEKKSRPEPQSPTTPIHFELEQADAEVLTTPTRSDMEEKDSVGPRTPLSQSTQFFSRKADTIPIRAATDNPQLAAPNPVATSSSGEQAGSNPLMPPATAQIRNSQAGASRRSSNTPGDTQLRTSVVGPTGTSTPLRTSPFNLFYLLLCIKNSKYLTQWTPLEVTNSSREALLFDAMRKEYQSFKRRKALFWLIRWVSLKDVIAIKFIKFVLLEGNDIDHLEEDQVPGVNDRHYDIVRDYNGTIPRSYPYTPTYMMHKFTSRRNCGHGTEMWQRFPKRKGQIPFRGLPPDFDTAWGLLLQEGFSSKRVGFVVFLSCILTLLFSTIWAPFHSISDAFAIGAYMLALVACFQAFLSWRDAH